MTRRPTPAPAALRPAPALALLLALACAPTPPPAPAPEPPVEPAAPTVAVASVQQIMDAMVIPASSAVWDVGRGAPEGDEAWQALANASVQLAEAGNLLLIGERLRDDEVWVSTAGLLRDAGARALAAVEARDVDALLDAGNALVDSCELCHERHLVPTDPPDPPAP